MMEWRGDGVRASLEALGMSFEFSILNSEFGKAMGALNGLWV